MAGKDGFSDSYDNDTAAQAYVLRLFITGASPNSIRAVENTRSICDEHLNGRYELEIIDIHQQPELAQGEDVVAVPLLIKKSPLPERRMIGDMSDTHRVLVGLGLATNN